MREERNGQTNGPTTDVKSKVMTDIRNHKIKMRSPWLFAAEKIGLESAIAVALICGTLLVSLIFYFFEKTSLLKYWIMGPVGMRVFFQALPYSYIILFVAFILAAVWLANRLEAFRGQSERTDHFAVLFFGGAIILGLILGALGIGRYVQGWDRQDVPRNLAVHGRILDATGESVLVRDDDGRLTTVFLEGAAPPNRSTLYQPGKFLQAVGSRDPDDHSVFYAKKILCCNSN
jgi:hypothetical protein